MYPPVLDRALWLYVNFSHAKWGFDPNGGVFLVTKKQVKDSVQQATDNYIRLMIDIEIS